MSGADAFGWKSAWDEYDADDGDDPAMHGVKYYNLPTENHPHRIYEGDQFWDLDGRHLLEVTSVRTKIYRGVVGGKGEEGNDCVFLEADWTPPRDPHTRHDPLDDVQFMNVEDFAEQIDEGALIPHRGNGVRAPPY